MLLAEQDLLRIFEATRAIASTLRLSELLEKVVKLASEVVHAEAGSLLLMDQATGELYFDVALGEKRRRAPADPPEKGRRHRRLGGRKPQARRR